MHDTPRTVATELDSPDFTLTIEDALQLYANAGHPRTPRTIQRYCALGHLECRKVTTTIGDKYFVSPQSVTRHIAQIAEMSELSLRSTMHDMARLNATGRDESGNVVAVESTLDASAPAAVAPDASTTTTNQVGDTPRPGATQTSDTSASEPADSAMTTRYIQTIERENEFLRAQVNTKDKQLTELSARFSDTQKLVAGLQRMFAPLLGQADPYRMPSTENDERPDQPLS